MYCYNYLPKNSPSKNEKERMKERMKGGEEKKKIKILSRYLLMKYDLQIDPSLPADQFLF